MSLVVVVDDPLVDVAEGVTRQGDRRDDADPPKQDDLHGTPGFTLGRMP